MIYILTFLVSSAFVWIGTRECTKRKMEDGMWKTVRLKKIPVLIGLLLPALLASMRAVSVGSDVSFYVVPLFNKAINSNSFSDYVAILGGDINDVGYCLLNYILSRFTTEIGWLFFATELIIVFFTFAGCWQLRGKAYPWLSMLFFYFLFYNITLSTVRQSCALAISFFALSYLFEKQFSKDAIIKSIICVMVACTFHRTAVFEFAIILIAYLSLKNKFSVAKFTVAACVGCLVARLFATRFLAIVSGLIGLVTSKYTNEFFLSTNTTGASGYRSITVLAAVVTILQFAYMKREKKDYWKGINKALFSLNMLYIFAMLFLSSFAFIPRLMYYVQFLWCVSFAQGTKLVKEDRLNICIATILLLAIAFSFWTFFFVIGNVHGTYPYTFR